MPYETGYPKCRTFGMNDSQKYPGLCKPYEIEKNVGNDYAELSYNSIISQPSPPSYYTYKTLNGEYDGKVDRSIGLISNNDNVQPSAPRIQVYNTNPRNPSNNLAAYSYNKRQGGIAIAPSQNQHQQKQTQYNHQQQRQQNYRPILPSTSSATTTTMTTTSTATLQRQQQTNHYQLTPYQRAPSIKQQTHYQEKRTFDKNDPIHQMAMRTYRWDLLFKKNHL
jgi:hypothetical protein